MADNKVQIVPLNSGVLAGISLEELEDRLEMQMLGLLDEFAVALIVCVCNCRPVQITVSGA